MDTGWPTLPMRPANVRLWLEPFPRPNRSIRFPRVEGSKWLALNSKDLFYRSGNKRMAVEITTSPTLTVGTPRVLFEGDFVNSPGGRAYWDATRGRPEISHAQKGE